MSDQPEGLAWRTLKNSIYGVLEYGWPILLALVATPYILRTLGADAFGVFSIVGVTLGFIGFLDLGVGGAAIRHLAGAWERRDVDEFNRVMSTVLAFYVGIGLLGGAAVVALAHPLVTQILTVPESVQSVAETAFYVAAVGVVVNLVMGTVGTVPRVVQRFDISTKISVVLGTVNTIGSVLALYLGYGLPGVVIASLVVNIIALPVVVRVAGNLVPGLRPRLHFDMQLFKSLAGFGLFYLASTVGVTMLYQLDKLLVGSILGTAAVTYYVLPGNLANKIQGLVAAATAVIFPVSAALTEGGHRETLVELYREGTRFAYILILMMAVPMAIFADRFLLHWVGAEIAGNSATAMVLLVITYGLLSASSIPWGIANGSGRAKVNAVFTFGIAALDVGLFFVLVRPFGVDGAAAAYLISACVGVPLLVSYIEKNIIGLSGGEFLAIAWRPLLAGVLQGAAAFMARPLVTNLFGALIIMALSALSFPAIYVALGFLTEGDRRVLRLLSSRFRSRAGMGPGPEGRA